MGRVGVSLVALGSLFFFTNMQMAVAATDGSCSTQSTQANGGSHNGGFDLFGSLGDIFSGAGNLAGSAWNGIKSVVSGVDWSRVGRDAWAFVSNFAIGAAITLGVIALGAAAVAAGIVSAPVLAVIGVVLGVAGLVYLGYYIYKNHNNMSEADWFGLAGNITGGLVAGFGAGAAVSRGVGAWVSGLLGRDAAAIAATPKVAPKIEPNDPAPAPVRAPAPPVRPTLNARQAWALVKQVYNNSSGLQMISKLNPKNPGEVASTLDQLAAGIKAKYGLNIKYVPDNSMPNLSVRNPGTWSEADNTIYFNESVRNDPQQWINEFRHEYGAYLLGQQFGGKGMIPAVDGGGMFSWTTHMLDFVGESGGKSVPDLYGGPQ